MSKYYIEKRVTESVTISVMGRNIDIPFKSLGGGVIGVCYVYDDKKSVEKNTKNCGYIIVEQVNEPTTTEQEVKV